VLAFAATKANTTPDPTPTSSTNGGVVEASPNRSFRYAVSDAEESVSSNRYESSAGSYTRSKQTWAVDGVGSMVAVLFEIGGVGVDQLEWKEHPSLE